MPVARQLSIEDSVKAVQGSSCWLTVICPGRILRTSWHMPCKKPTWAQQIPHLLA